MSRSPVAQVDGEDWAPSPLRLTEWLPLGFAVLYLLSLPAVFGVYLLTAPDGNLVLGALLAATAVHAVGWPWISWARWRGTLRPVPAWMEEAYKGRDFVAGSVVLSPTLGLTCLTILYAEYSAEWDVALPKWLESAAEALLLAAFALTAFVVTFYRPRFLLPYALRRAYLDPSTAGPAVIDPVRWSSQRPPLALRTGVPFSVVPPQGWTVAPAPVSAVEADVLIAIGPAGDWSRARLVVGDRPDWTDDHARGAALAHERDAWLRRHPDAHAIEESGFDHELGAARQVVLAHREGAFDLRTALIVLPAPEPRRLLDSPGSALLVQSTTDAARAGLDDVAADALVASITFDPDGADPDARQFGRNPGAAHPPVGVTAAVTAPTGWGSLELLDEWMLQRVGADDLAGPVVSVSWLDRAGFESAVDAARWFERRRSTDGTVGEPLARTGTLAGHAAHGFNAVRSIDDGPRVLEQCWVVDTLPWMVLVVGWSGTGEQAVAQTDAVIASLSIGTVGDR